MSVPEPTDETPRGDAGALVETAVVGDDARHRSPLWASYEHAADVGRRLPLVDRTWKPGSESRGASS